MSETPSYAPGAPSSSTRASGATSAAPASDTDGDLTINLRRSKSQVLVIEDDRAVLWMTTRILSAQGYDTISATTADEARALIRRGVIGLIIADLHLADVTAMAWLYDSANQARIPYIIVSGDDSPEARQRALRAGAQAFFRKPFDMDELLPLVARCLSGDLP